MSEVSLYEAALDLEVAGLKDAALEAWRYEARRLDGVVNRLEDRECDLQVALQRAQEEVLALEHMLGREEAMHKVTNEARASWADASLELQKLVAAAEKDRDFWKSEARRFEEESAARRAAADGAEIVGSIVRSVGLHTFLSTLKLSGYPKPGIRELTAIQRVSGCDPGWLPELRSEIWK